MTSRQARKTRAEEPFTLASLDSAGANGQVPPHAEALSLDAGGGQRLWYCSAMMKRSTLDIADIYVPVKRRATLDQKRVDEIATSILDKGLQAPILVRADGARFVLVEGLHRLEAAKALGEKTIVGFLVEARKH